MDVSTLCIREDETWYVVHSERLQQYVCILVETYRMEKINARGYESRYLDVRRYSFDGMTYLVATEGRVATSIIRHLVKISHLNPAPGRTSHKRKQTLEQS